MNIIFDSSCWLEFFSDSINCQSYSNEIVKTDKIIIPSIIIYEVFRKLLTETEEDIAISLIGHLRECKIIEIDFFLSIFAAKLSKQYKIPMADSMILATAKQYNAILYTHDSHFENIPENIKYISKLI